MARKFFGSTFALITLALSLVISALVPSWAQTVKLEDLERSQINKLVRDALVENPEILDEALEALKVYRTVQQQQQVALTIKSNKDILLESPNNIVIGNPDAKISLIEFFDYNCSYCKRAFDVKMAILKKYPDVNLVLKEFPILSEDSMLAARVGVLVSKDEGADYAAFHEMMLTNPGRANLDSALLAAEAAGADIVAIGDIVAEREDDVTNAAIGESYAIAESLGINSTPTYILGNEVLAGALPMEQFETRIEELLAE